MAAEVVRVCLDHNVDAVLTYYADPHAEAANRAVRVLSEFGRHPVLLHSLEGSDVLDSICEHVEDRQAALLITDVVDADVLCAVSHYTADCFVRAVDDIFGAQAAEATASRVHIRYPGLPDSAFAAPAAEINDRDLVSLGIDPRRPVVSSIGRLAPEKGHDVVADVAEHAYAEGSPVQFVIAGGGEIGRELDRRQARLPNLFVRRDVDPARLHSLRAASAAGLLPTRAVPGFTETFCISALEYAAVGVPVLATRLGGVPEAVPGEDFLIEPTASSCEWWARLTRVLERRAHLGEAARVFARGFTDEVSASRILDLTTAALALRASA
ncbi:glycosyltransferase family 4 protein [Allokutzneria albata]|nr:glycosyltransferase family 4 protein [Allokutzneria albata]